MQKSNAEILHHFYALLLEINFRKPDESVWEDKRYSDDPFIQKNLQQIRLLTAKYKSLRGKSKYLELLDEIKRLKEIGAEKLNLLLNPREMAQLQPLFSKFEELSPKDLTSIAEDQELLQLLSALKNKLDEHPPEQ